MNSQALEYYQVLRSHKTRPKKDPNKKDQARFSQVMERSQSPSHLRC